MGCFDVNLASFRLLQRVTLQMDIPNKGILGRLDSMRCQDGDEVRQCSAKPLEEIKPVKSANQGVSPRITSITSRGENPPKALRIGPQMCVQQ